MEQESLEREKVLAIFKVDVFCSIEFEVEKPLSAKIKVTRGLVKRILKLSKALKDLDVCKVEAFDSGFTTYYEDEECEKESQAELECEHLVVSGIGFHFESYVRYFENSVVATDAIDIKVLEDILKVDQASDRELPPLMGEDLAPEAKDLIKQRFAGEGADAGIQK